MDELVKRMEALAHITDLEAAHTDADVLLLEALELLGDQAGERPVVDRLVEAYHQIDKHYA